MKTTRWTGCYEADWRDICLPDAYAHPAKMRPGMMQRLYPYLIKQGYVRPGAVILDPFCGVGLGAFHALLCGLRWVGVELEDKFFALGEQHLTYWQQRYGLAQARILPGDSRELGAILAWYFAGTGTVQALVSSPPYEGSNQDYAAGYTYAGVKVGNLHPHDACRRASYGTTPGQLGAQPPGDVGAIVSSPPYNLPMSQDHNGTRGGQRGTTPSEPGAFVKYGATPGQLEGLPAGDFQAIVSSPPYEGTLSTEGNHIDRSKSACPGGTRASRGALPATAFSSSPAQLGNTTGDTFWSAASQILAECAAILPPGAVAVWIVKPFVRDKKIVPFDALWQALCEHHGFRLVERIEASLVEDHGTQETLFGAADQLTTAKKSFFRRLAERKGSPAIDAEIILIMRKETLCPPPP